MESASFRLYRQCVCVCVCVCVSDCIAHMFRKSTVSNLWLAIYWRYDGTGGMSEPKQFLPVKHLTARHWICEHTNEEIFSDKAKCIAKFFDFRLNVTHILRSVHSDAMLFLCAFRILFFSFLTRSRCWCCCYFLGERRCFRCRVVGYNRRRKIELLCSVCLFFGCVKCKM